MRKLNKSLLSWILILAMLLCTVPVTATETLNIEPPSLETPDVYVNPLHADVITEEDTEFYSITFFSEPEFNFNMEDWAAVLREGLKNRAPSIQVGLKIKEEDLTSDIARRIGPTIFNAAIEHTGISNEGDYLKYHWTEHEIYPSYSSNPYDYANRCWNVIFTYNVIYLSDYDQEEAVTEAVDAFTEKYIEDDMTDYEKFCVIYDWICDNVVYDYDHLNNNSYKLQYTAYAAMINKTAVCQGYANLLYRMLLEVGIDNRIISGIGNGGGHAWNIVELEGLYYNVDSTWDATWLQDVNRYNFCLQSNANFGDHIRDAEFTSAAFNAQYPMATRNYDPSKAAQSVSGHQVLTGNTSVKWYLTGDVYVDLAGFDMTGTIDLNGYQVYGMDSTTDKYTCENMGTFNCVNENGDEIVPDRHWKGTEDQIGSIKRYMTIETEEGYTFHRFYLGITHISMKPGEEDVGFKAVVAGDEMVMAQLDRKQAFAYSMHLGNENVVTVYRSSKEIASGHPIHLWSNHFDIDRNSEVTLYAQVMLKLSDGTEISTDEVSMTVRGMLEQLNNKYTSLIASQLKSIREMLARHPIVKLWGLDKLLGLS